MRNSETRNSTPVARRQQHQQVQDQYQPRRGNINTSSSYIPTASSMLSGNRRRPRPDAHTPSRLPTLTSKETPGDRLLSSLKALEDDLEDDDSSTSSAIWRATAPIVSQGTLTPMGPLIDELHSQNREHSMTNVVVHTTSASRIRLHDIDDLSLGDSTISTISDAESVFDRLYRLGCESAEKRRIRAQQENERGLELKRPMSRLSYTPKMTTPSPRTMHPRSSFDSSIPRKDRLSAYADSQSVASKSSQAKSRASNSHIPRVVTSNRNDEEWTQSSRSATVATDDRSSNSVFERLHRKHKRSQRLWSPATISHSKPNNKKTVTAQTATHRIASVDRKRGVQASRPPVRVDTTPDIAAEASLTPTASTKNTLDLLDELLAESPRTTTTIAATDDETIHGNWNLPNVTITEKRAVTFFESFDYHGTTGDEEDAETGVGSRMEPGIETTLEEDMAEIEDIGKILRSQNGEAPQLLSPLHEHKASLEENLEEIEPVGKSLKSHNEETYTTSLAENRGTTLDEDLAEIDQIGKTLKYHDDVSSHSIFIDDEAQDQDGCMVLQCENVKRSQQASPTEGLGTTLENLPSRDEETDHSFPPDLHEIKSELDFVDVEVVRIESRSKNERFMSSRASTSNDNVDMIDLLLEADDHNDHIFSEEPKAPALSSAPTPRRKTTKPCQDDNNIIIPTSLARSPFRLRDLTISFETSCPHAFLAEASSHSSRGSSGFYSLDEPSLSLVMNVHDDNNDVPLERISKAIEVGTLQQAATPRRVLLAAATTIQSKWRCHQAELRVAHALLVSFRVEFSNPLLHRSSITDGLRRIHRNLTDPYIEADWKMDVETISIVWKTSLSNMRVTVSVEVSTAGCHVMLEHWGHRKLLRLFLLVALSNEIKEQLVEAATMIQRMVRKALRTINRQKVRSVERASLLALLDFGGGDEDLLVDCGHSLASACDNFSPALVDVTKVRKYRAAATIQDWFRMQVLKAALQSSLDSQDQLQQALDSLSNSSHDSNSKLRHDSNLICARRLLRESSSQRTWIDRSEANGTTEILFSPKSGTFSQQWIERRAATLAIHNIVQAYLRGLQRYRRLRKIICIQQNCRRWLYRNHYLRQLTAALIIQKNWRSHLLLNHHTEAIIRIQSKWRSMLAQRKWECVRFSAIWLQATFRGTFARRKLQHAQRLALLIQAIHRSRSHRIRFLRLRSSVSSVQLLFRRRVLKLMFHRHWTSATVIQTRWRCSHLSWNWKHTKNAILCLQQHWRKQLARIMFQRKRSSVISIQTTWRHRIERQQVWCKDFASVQIQTQWRCFYYRRVYDDRIRCIIKLQSMFRRFIARKAHKLMQQRRVKTVVQLQTVFRRFRAIKILQRKVSALIRIQSLVRGMSARKRSHVMLRSIALLQALLRRHLRRRQYVFLISMVVCLQKYSRGSLARSRLTTGRVAAIMIQANWRGRYQRRRMSKQLQSAFILQRITRGFLSRKDARARNIAAIKIQDFARFILARRRIILLNNSVALIQSIWRGSEARHSFTNCRSTATMIQACYRGHRHRRLLQRQVTAALCIQSLARTLHIQGRFEEDKTRKKQILQEKACTIIQTRWRTIRAQAHFDSTRHACLLMQSTMRLWFATEKSRRLKQHRKGIWATELLQRHIRVLLARSKYTHMRISAIMIQAAWRGFQERIVIERRKVLVILQAWWRKCSLSTSYQNKRRACIKLQALCRRTRAVATSIHMTRSAIVIQTGVRAARSRERYLMIKAVVIMIQALMRRSLTRVRVQRCNIASFVIQLLWRRHRIRRKCHQRVCLRHLYREARETKAARKIQICYRQSKSRLNHRLIEEANAAVRIQRVYSRSKKHRKYGATTTIQRYVRGANARTAVGQSVSSATKIQAYIRRYRQKVIYSKHVRASVRIQSHWRAWLAKGDYNNDRASCLKIQALMRGNLCRDRLMFLNLAASKIQQAWRAHFHVIQCFQRKQRRKLYQVARQAKNVRKIQKIARARLKLQHGKIRLALVLQSYWRAKCVRGHSARFHSAAVTIQAIFRRSSVRAKYVKFVFVVSLLQAVIRMRIAMTAYKAAVRSAVVVQCEWRRSHALDQYLKARGSVAMLQAFARGYLCRASLQRCVITNDTFEQSAIIVQKYWKGHWRRKKYQRIRSSSIHIQSWVRRFRTQSVFWFFLQPRHVRDALNAAARKIQLAFLLWKMQMALLEMESSSVILQRCMRGQLVRSAARFALSHMNSSMKSAPLSPVARISSPTNVQTLATFSAWDRAVDRARINASIVIQAAARRMLVRMRLQLNLGLSFGSSVLVASISVSAKDSVATIQHGFRRQKLMRQNEGFTMRGKAQTPVISSPWRDQDIDGIHDNLDPSDAARRLQKAFRLWKLKRDGAAIDIRRFFRRVISRKAYRQHIESQVCRQKNGAVISHQQNILMMSSVKWNISATKIQCVARGVLAKKHYLCLQKRKDIFSSTVVLVQNVARVALAKKCFLELQRRRYKIVSSVVNIQRVARFTLAKKSYLDLKRRMHLIFSAALVIQRVARAYLAMHDFQRLQRSNMKTCAAAIIIQRLARVSMVKKNYIDLQKRKRVIYSAVVCIQRVARVTLAKNNYYDVQRRKLMMVSAAVIIQCVARAFLAKHNFRCFQISKMKTYAAAVVIQRLARVLLATKNCNDLQKRKRMIRSAVVNIQRVARVTLAKNNYHGYQRRKLMFDSAAVIIQRVARVSSAKVSRHYLQRRKQNVFATFDNQRVAKPFLDKIHLCNIENRQPIFLSSASQIQRFYRGHLCRKNIMALHGDARVIQSKRHQYGHSLPDISSRKIQAVCMIQANFRVWRFRRNIEKPITSSILHVVKKKRLRDEDEAVRQYIGHLEVLSLNAVAGLDEGIVVDLGGPCMNKLAEYMRMVGDEACSLRESPLPSFIEEVQTLSTELDKAKELMLEPPSTTDPEIDCIGRKVCTPVRSNKSVTASPESSEIVSFAKSAANSHTPQDFGKDVPDIVLQKSTDMHVGKLRMPVLPATFNEKMESVSPIIARSHVTTSVSESKLAMSVPSESFFEGESKDIPSPIKREDVEEWDWTDEW